MIGKLSLDIRSGEFVAIIGPSGCGKSTLLSLLAGYLTPSSGRVLFRGVPISRPGRERMMVFQQPALFPDLSVAENISIGRGFETGRGGRVRWRAVNKRARGLIERFEIAGVEGFDVRFDEILDHPPDPSANAQPCRTGPIGSTSRERILTGAAR